MKNLLLSTAVLAALGNLALAQDAMAPGIFRPAADPMALRASDFIGMRIYAAEGTMQAADVDGMQDNWNDIGEVNDVILSRDGIVDAVLVDIGGFLGVGERQVAVGMEAIQFLGDTTTPDDTADFFLVMTATQAELESAPDYMRGDMGMTDDTMINDTMTNAATADATSTDAPLREPVMRDGFMVAEAEYLTSDTLTGAYVYDVNDEVIGNVSTLILTEDGQVTQAIIDVGGFLGIGEKPVALDLAQIEILRNEAGDDVRVYLSQTREELEAMPTFEG